MGDCRLGGLPFCESQRRIALRHRNGAVPTSENTSSSSTLAIWPGNTPHHSGALQTPLGLFPCRWGRPTRKKSPCEENLHLVGGFVMRKEGQGAEVLLMVSKGQAPRSSALRNWGEGHIYLYCSLMAKVEPSETV